MIISNSWLDADGQQLLPAKLNAIAVEDRRKQDVDLPVQPFADELAGGCLVALELSKRIGQMFYDGRRLQSGVSIIEQNRNLPLARQRTKLRRLMNAFLKAHVSEDKRFP
jgi:hypothetical protein